MGHIFIAVLYLYLGSSYWIYIETKLWDRFEQYPVVGLIAQPNDLCYCSLGICVDDREI